jgi:hypothetical protein
MTMTTISAIKATSPITFEFTEHNRSSLPIGYEPIENVQRTANGTMRKFVVAKKRNFQVSWTMLPSRKNLTIDNKYGAEGIRDFYNTYCFDPITIEVRTHRGSNLSISSDDNSTTMTAETVNVFITAFSYDVVKRLNDSGGGFDYVNVSIGFTEI